MSIAERIGANREVLALSAARLGDAAGNSILFVVIPLYVAQLPAPSFPFPETVRVGLLISLYGIVNAVLQPFAGALSDRFGRRKLFIQVGLLLMAVSTLAFAPASRLIDLMVLRVLQGIGVALTITASISLMATITTKQSRGGSMGIFTSMRMAGFAVGPLIGGFLQDRFGFNASFYTGTALILLGLLLVQLWVKDPAADPDREVGPFQVIDRDLLTAGLVGVGFATFVMAVAFSMLVTLEQQFNTRLNQSALAFGASFSALMFSRFLFQIPLGRLSDRVGRRPLILAGLTMMAVATALMGLVISTLQLVGLRILQGIASAAIAAPSFALAADLARAGREGRQMSLVTMGFGLGIALGPLIAGVLAVSSLELPFLVGGLMSLVGAWVVYRYVPETVRRAGK